MDFGVQVYFPGCGVGGGNLPLLETYRAVYTVRFTVAVYFLHVFQKKSRKGIATPQHEIDLIRDRLKLAEADYKRGQSL
jgi:phage-related protein